MGIRRGKSCRADAKVFPKPSEVFGSVSNPGRLPEAEHAFYQALEIVLVDQDSEFVYIALNTPMSVRFGMVRAFTMLHPQKLF